MGLDRSLAARYLAPLDAELAAPAGRGKAGT